MKTSSSNRPHAARPGAILPLLASMALVGLSGCGDGGDRSASQDPPIPYADPVAPKANHPADGAAGSSSEPAASGANAGAGGVVRSGPFEKRFERVALAIPEGWDEVELAQSQKGFVDARFVAKTKAGLVELTCLSSRGGLDANISRWIGQFTLDPDGRKAETVKVDGAEARWVDLTGTFNAASSGKSGPHANWRMLGAGIPADDGDFFLKLNGPKDAVAEVSDAFREMVKSARLISR